MARLAGIINKDAKDAPTGQFQIFAPVAMLEERSEPSHK